MKKQTLIQVIRHIIQLLSFLLYPGLFIMTWSAIKDIYQSLIQGAFVLSSMVSPLMTLLIVFGVTIIWGRFFCGYLCSFGAMQELIRKAGELCHIKRIDINKNMDHDLKYMKYVIIILFIALWTLKIDVSTLSPWNAFGIIISLNGFSQVLCVGGFILLLIMILSLLIDRPFCRFLCPLGGLFRLVSHFRFFKVKQNEKCVHCSLCTKNCPMAIDVQNKSQPSLKDGECIDCLQCITSCPKDALNSSSQAGVQGTVAALSMLGMSYVGNIVVDHHTPTTVTSSQQGNFKDGTYTGSGQGYRGQTDVEVIVKDGNIQSITITSYEDDDQFFNKAKNTIIQDIIEKQTTDVSTVSGATYSSQGIMNAIKDALGEQSNEGLIKDEQESSNNTSYDFTDLKDGTYQGTGQGRNGDIDVEVVVKDNKVTSITITDSSEDESFYTRAKEQVIPDIIDKQSLNVQTVSGATMTSNGILEAVANALNIDYTNNNSEIYGHGGHRGQGKGQGRFHEFQH